MRLGRFFRRGQAATELALAAPVLGLLLIGTADFARAFYFNQEVIAAARAGAQYGSADRWQRRRLDRGIKAAAVANAVNIPGFELEQCHYQLLHLLASDRSNRLRLRSYCNGANSQASYVTVTATATFNTLVHYPGVPQTSTMSATAIMQVQNSGQNGS